MVEERGELGAVKGTVSRHERAVFAFNQGRMLGGRGKEKTPRGNGKIVKVDENPSPAAACFAKCYIDKQNSPENACSDSARKPLYHAPSSSITRLIASWTAIIRSPPRSTTDSSPLGRKPALVVSGQAQ
jgi:hypothetical protein